MQWKTLPKHWKYYASQVQVVLQHLESLFELEHSIAQKSHFLLSPSRAQLWYPINFFLSWTKPGQGEPDNLKLVVSLLHLAMWVKITQIMVKRGNCFQKLSIWVNIGQLGPNWSTWVQRGPAYNFNPLSNTELSWAYKFHFVLSPSQALLRYVKFFRPQT